jgi:hypothetical protein
MLCNPFLIFLGGTLFDLALAIVLISLFATAYPDRFRTVLWQEGGTKGWNSDPHQRVYDYANYRESPPIPLIWDERSPPTSLTWHLHRALTHEAAVPCATFASLS